MICCFCLLLVFCLVLLVCLVAGLVWYRFWWLVLHVCCFGLCAGVSCLVGVDSVWFAWVLARVCLIPDGFDS